MTHLLILLQNLYNAPWPKTFSPEGFVGPYMETITDSKDLKDYTAEEQKFMAEALLFENQDISTSSFYYAYLFPIQQILNK